MLGCPHEARLGRSVSSRLQAIHIVSALALHVLALAGVTAAQTAQSYRQQAAELVRSKSWDEAIAAYRKALEL